MSLVAIGISILALLFAVLSFWWMNWRKGLLHVYPPRSYAAYASKNTDRAIIEFPFVFFNDGPTPIIVHNLRIVFVGEEPDRPFAFTATVKALGKDEMRALATQFPVTGRQPTLLICEFQRKSGGIEFELEQRAYPLELQGQLKDGAKWKILCPFRLYVSAAAAEIAKRQFIAHDNTPEDWAEIVPSPLTI